MSPGFEKVLRPVLPRTRRAWWAVLVPLALIIALALGACGGDDDGGPASVEQAADDPECDGVATVKIGTQPIASAATLYVAEDQGYFEDERIEIDFVEGLQGGAASVAGVISGSEDFGFSDYVGAFFAAAEGLPIRFIAHGAAHPPENDEAYLVVLARKGSRIEGPEDLADKTIAINAVNNVTDVTIKGALEKHGVDSDSVEFVEVPFPEAQAALEQNRVDAAFMVEPFLTPALQAGHVPVLYPVSEVAPTGAINGFFTSEETLNDRRCVVERFASAMDQANEYAAENPDAVRELIPSFTEIPRDVVADMRLPGFGDTTLDAAESFNATMVELGLLEEEVDLSTLFPLQM